MLRAGTRGAARRPAGGGGRAGLSGWGRGNFRRRGWNAGPQGFAGRARRRSEDLVSAAPDAGVVPAVRRRGRAPAWGRTPTGGAPRFATLHLLRVLRLPPCSPCATLLSGRAGPGRSGKGAGRQQTSSIPRPMDRYAEPPPRVRPANARGFPADRLAPTGILPPASPRRRAVHFCQRRPVEIDVMHELAPSGTPLGSRRRQ